MKIASSESISAPPSIKPRINWKYQFQQYGFAFAVALFLFAVLSIYLFYRRGYYDLYIANKVFAGVSAVLLGIVILIGPGSRFFSFPDRYVQYRKELGIVAFFLAIIHVIISRSATLNWPIVFGFVAAIILIAIFFISNDRAMNALGRKRWWWLQYWGVRLAFVLVIFHVFIMKWNGWVKWYQVGGGKELMHPEWPGAGLLIGWFMAFVILIRLAEFISPKLGKTVWYISVVTLPLIYIATFWVGKTIY